MAKETAASLFIGEDHQFKFAILDDAEAVAQNITGWALSWMVKRRKGDLDSAKLLELTTSGGAVTISGTFNADPSVNTQRATVTVQDTDTDALTPGLAYYELKRTDAGFETILAFGVLNLKRAVHNS